jgi:hypothetical protein
MLAAIFCPAVLVAVMVTTVDFVTVNVLMLNIAHVALAGIVTDVSGAATFELELVRVSVRGVVDAAPARVILPKAFSPPGTVLGTITIVPITTGETVRVALHVAVPTVAVMLTEVVLVTAVVLIVNQALAQPAGTVTWVMGFPNASAKVTPVLVLVKPTTVPPVGAAELSVTNPVEALPPVTLGGESTTPASGLRTVNVALPLVPPPGVGLVTVMLNVPAVVRSLAGIVTLSDVGLL